jgi:cystathionine beta-lyase
VINERKKIVSPSDQSHIRPNTLQAHGGRTPAAFHGAVNTPVYRCSTITAENMAELMARETDKYNHVSYGRFGTPTTQDFESLVAEMEGGCRTISTSSGLAAITGALSSFVGAGDHILMTDSAYFPTRKFCDQILKKQGVETTYYDPKIGADIKHLIKNTTKVVFCESPGSLTFEIQDIPAIAAEAHKKGAIVMMDNTWGTPLFFKPFEKGVDVSIQAATKYIVGHSDAMLGTITINNPDLFMPIKDTVATYGFSVGSEEAYLGLRGLRTLSQRLRQHQESGLLVAKWLESRPEVAQVLHPALPGAPGHDLWMRDFTGACGLFSVVFTPHANDALTAMMDSYQFFALGYSWGGYESLVIPADRGIIRTATQWHAQGPTLRYHVGLEDPQDLIADLENGFQVLADFKA